jgi:hypothetical protein
MHSDSPARTTIFSVGVTNSIAPFSIVVICSLTWLCVGTREPFRVRSLAIVMADPWIIWRVAMVFNGSSVT